MDELSSFSLELEYYCDYCPYFKAHVGKFDVTKIGDKTPKVVTSIQCEHAGECRQISERLSEKANAGGN